MKRFFSLIALVGVLVACQPEKIETSFEKASAVATINVTTVDLQSGSPITTAAISADKGTVSGQVVTITGTPSISKMTVKVTARYNNVDYSENVEINGLLAGGVATYSVIIVVGEPISDYTFSVSAGTPTVETQTAYLDAATISHSGKMWVSNDTEFILTGTVKYPAYTGAEATCEVLNNDFASIVEAYKDAYNVGITSEELILPIVVSAYAYYTSYETRTFTTTVYNVVATKGTESATVGKVTVKAASSNAAVYEEMAAPGSHGTYIEGHGTHGSGANAGGGIAFAE